MSRLIAGHEIDADTRLGMLRAVVLAQLQYRGRRAMSEIYALILGPSVWNTLEVFLKSQVEA